MIDPIQHAKLTTWKRALLFLRLAVVLEPRKTLTRNESLGKIR